MATAPKIKISYEKYVRLVRDKNVKAPLSGTALEIGTIVYGGVGGYGVYERPDGRAFTLDADVELSPPFNPATDRNLPKIANAPSYTGAL